MMNKKLTMSQIKKVTVLMPVYNAEEYLKESIDSILGQSYKDFEFLIINDGSTDSSEQIILSYEDDRIKYIKNDENIGLIKTLNKGIKLAKTDYIARMDADDISNLTRIEKQVNYMEKNKDIAVLGTSIEIFNDNGIIRKHKVNTEPLKIKTQLLFTCALMHPTVIIRKDVLDKQQLFYNERHQSAEDFGLWQRMSFEYKLANLDEVLLKYRINENGITEIAERNIDKRDKIHMIIYNQGFEYLGIKASEIELKLFRLFITGRALRGIDEIKIISDLLKQLTNLAKNKEYDLNYIEQTLVSYFRHNGINRGMHFREIRKIHREYFLTVFSFDFREQLKYVIKRYLL